MSPATIIADLHAIGVTLTPHGDKLRIRAPVGALTPAWRRMLADSKAALLASLTRPPPSPMADEWRIIAPMPGPDTPIRSCDCPRAHRVNCLTRVNGIPQWICLRCHVPVTKLARLPAEVHA